MKKILPELVESTQSIDEKEKEILLTIISGHPTKTQLAKLLDILSNEKVELSINDRAQRALNETFDLINSDDPEKNKKAEEILTKIIKQERRVGGAHYFLAKLYKKQNRLKEAEATLSDGIKISPNISMYHKELGMIFYLMGKTEYAMQEYKKAINLGSTNFLVYIVYGKHLENKGEILKAANSYEKAMKYKPENDNEKTLYKAMYFEIAKIHKKLGNCSKAVRFAKKGIETSGNYRIGQEIITACRK